MHHPEQDITMPALSQGALPEQTGFGILNALRQLQEQTLVKVVEGTATVVFGTYGLAACSPGEAAASAPKTPAGTSQTVESSKTTTPNPSAKTSPTDIPKATTAPNATPTTSPNTAPAVDNEAAIAFHRTLTKDAFNRLSRPERLAVVWDRYKEMYDTGRYAALLGNYDKDNNEVLMPDGRGLYDHNPADPANMPSPTDGADKILGQLLFAEAFADACSVDKTPSRITTSDLDLTCYHQLVSGEVYDVGDADRTGVYKSIERWPDSVQNKAVSIASIPGFSKNKAISIVPAEGQPAEVGIDSTGKPTRYKTLVSVTSTGARVEQEVALVSFPYRGQVVQLWLTIGMNGRR